MLLLPTAVTPLNTKLGSLRWCIKLLEVGRNGFRE